MAQLLCTFHCFSRVFVCSYLFFIHQLSAVGWCSELSGSAACSLHERTTDVALQDPGRELSQRSALSGPSGPATSSAGSPAWREACQKPWPEADGSGLLNGSGQASPLSRKCALSGLWPRVVVLLIKSIAVMRPCAQSLTRGLALGPVVFKMRSVKASHQLLSTVQSFWVQAFLLTQLYPLTDCAGTVIQESFSWISNYICKKINIGLICRI